MVYKTVCGTFLPANCGRDVEYWWLYDQDGNLVDEVIALPGDDWSNVALKDHMDSIGVFPINCRMVYTYVGGPIL